MNKLGSLLLALVLLAGAPSARAQKFGWVDSEFIMAKMPDYAKAQVELTALTDTWQKELEAQKKDLDKLYRSAGVGARIVMSAFGLLGFDFGHGFDSVVPQANTAAGTKQDMNKFHFIIGQQIR